MDSQIWLQSITTFPFWMESKAIFVLLIYFLLEFTYLFISKKKIEFSYFYSRSGIWDLISLAISVSSLGYIFHNLIFFGLPLPAYTFLKSLQLPVITELDYTFRLVLAVFAYDFLSYWRHRFFHSHEIFWSAHFFHHSATKLTAITNLRSHPIQNLFSNLLVGVPLAIVFQINVYDSFIFYIFSYAWGFFQHGRIDTNLGWIGRHILVTPRFHHLHHSINGSTHKNFGEFLVIWDKIFGTYESPTVPIEKIHAGVKGNYFETDSMIVAFFKPIIIFYKGVFSELFRKNKGPSKNTLA